MSKTGRPDDWKVTLVFFHHRDQHIPRQGQRFLVKPAHHGRGHFDQVGHFIQQAFFDDGFPTDQGRGLIDLFHDGGFALFFIQHDSRFADHIEILSPRKGSRSPANHTDAIHASYCPRPRRHIQTE